MLQQPLARRVAGAARYAAAGEALPGALPLSSMRRRARGLRAAPFQPMERQRCGLRKSAPCLLMIHLSIRKFDSY